MRHKNEPELRPRTTTTVDWRSFYRLQTQSSSYELDQPSHCQRGILAMPRSNSILLTWVWFLDTMMIIHQPTNWKPVFLIFLFLSERYDRNNDPKKYKSDHNLSLKRKKENCTSGPNTRLNFQIENRKIERGIAEMPFSPFSAENTWLICIWNLSLIHIWRCRRSTLCRSRWSPSH